METLYQGTGQSAVACSAYRSCERLVSESGKKVFNYTKKTGLIAEGLHCPDGLEMSREKLWNLVEATEKRKDARLAKEFIVALPHELPKKEHRKICELIAKQLASGDRFADWQFMNRANEETTETFMRTFNYRKRLEPGNRNI